MIITYLIQNNIVAIKRLKVAQLKGNLRARLAITSFVKSQSIGDADVDSMVKSLIGKKIAYLTEEDGYELEDCVFQLFPRV